MIPFTKKTQRLNCLISLTFVRNYMYYPREYRPDYLDQLGAEIIFGDNWKRIYLLRLVVNLVLPFVMIAIDVYLILKYLCKLVFYKRKVFCTDKLLVSCHHRLYSIGLYAKLINDDSVWFRTPLDLYELPKYYKTYTVFDFISVLDVFACMLQSIRCRWHFINRYGYENFMLTRKCFEWLITDIALRKVSSDTALYFSNQLDRLAVLIDRLPQHEKCLVEHGIEYLYTESDIQKKNKMLVFHKDVNFYVLNRTYHFHHLTRVYCYSDIDIKAFSRSIVRCNPEYIVIGYDFKPTFKPQKKSILIIGEYYNQYENEKTIISSLQELDIELFLKGHPGNSDELYSDLRSTCKFIYIPGKSKELPDADLVISYDSTLAHEYESVGSKVIYYGCFDLEDIRSYVSRLLNIVSA